MQEKKAKKKNRMKKKKRRTQFLLGTYIVMKAQLRLINHSCEIAYRIFFWCGAP